MAFQDLVTAAQVSNPQSDLLYISMSEDNFKKCWALSNLRPYSAKQNLLDSNRK